MEDKIIYSVKQINNYVKDIFDNIPYLKNINVKGEVSNCTYNKSGHVYFTLKDEESQIKCVIWKFKAYNLKFKLEDGQKIVVNGEITEYVALGQYQINVNSCELDGVGALYIAFEKLKTKLYEEGLFNDAHKKKIPVFPNKIGVVTSPTGAVIRDILNVTSKRYTLADIILYPAQVQGAGAEKTLIKGLEYFESRDDIDVVIIGRGGGSMEDLWCFNNEELARKVYDFSIPIISAVGHETDTTLIDFVADKRAATPSQAAEFAVPNKEEYLQRLDDLYDRLTDDLNKKFNNLEETFNRYRDSVNPDKLYNIIVNFKEKLDSLKERSNLAVNHTIDNCYSSLDKQAKILDSLNPLSVITRGFSVATNKDKVIKCVNDVEINDQINIRLSDGSVDAVIKNKNKGK